MTAWSLKQHCPEACGLGRGVLPGELHRRPSGSSSAPHLPGASPYPARRHGLNAGFTAQP